MIITDTLLSKHNKKQSSNKISYINKIIIISSDINGESFHLPN